MCVSASQASFSDTILYAAEMCRAGEIVHVMGYQNAAVNKVIGGNAMILPIPALGDLGPENVIDTRSFRSVLRDLVSSLQPRSRSMMKGGGAYKVFDSGDYTVVLTKDASTIREALLQVDEWKRPYIADDLLSFYAHYYAGWHIAVCCFNRDNMPTPDPLLWWYQPMNPNLLFAPGVDAHNGRPPDLRPGRDVHRDHAVVFGSAHSTGASTSIQKKLPGEHQWMFNGRFSLTSIQHSTPNTDFVLPVEVARSGRHVSWRDMVE